MHIHVHGQGGRSASWWPHLSSSSRGDQGLVRGLSYFAFFFLRHLFMFLRPLSSG